jgi:hypothetical protein
MSMCVRTQFLYLKGKLESVERFPNVSAFTKFLSMMLSDFDLKFKTKRSTHIDHNMVVFSGAYDPEDDKQTFPCIDIEVFYSPTQKDIVTKHLDIDFVLLDLYETVYHEKMHQQQYRSRKFKRPATVTGDTREQIYLGCKDEIEAYAAEIAVALYINETYNLHKEICDNSVYKHYASTFGHDHKILGELFEHSSKYFNKLQEHDHVLR